MGANYLPRIYARVAICGFWIAMLGVVTLIVVGQSLALLPAGVDGALGTAGFSVGGLVTGALVNLFEAGLISMFFGGTMMAGGAFLVLKLP